MEAKYPGKHIVVRQIVDSRRRADELARPEVELEARRSNDAVERARTRIAALRDRADTLVDV
jgi:hypothetical protein